MKFNRLFLLNPLAWLLAAWNTPNTQNPSDVLSASNYNLYVRDNLNYLFSGRVASQIVREGVADYTTTSATFANVDGTNLLTAATINSTRALCIFAGKCSTDNTASSSGEIDILCDAARKGSTNGLLRTNQNLLNQPFMVIALFTGLSIGSHNFSPQFRNFTAGATFTIHNNVQPLSFFVMEL